MRETQRPPSPFIVEIDSREHYPIPFPANIFLNTPSAGGKRLALPVETVTVKLDAGDYRLASHPSGCVIERKASQAELLKNLFSPRDSLRQAAAFHRLASSCRYPYLLIEMSLHEFFQGAQDLTVSPDELLHRLYHATAHYNLRLLWVPRTADRRLLGISLLHLMLAHALCDAAPSLTSPPPLQATLERGVPGEPIDFFTKPEDSSGQNAASAAI